MVHLGGQGEPGLGARAPGCHAVTLIAALAVLIITAAAPREAAAQSAIGFQAGGAIDPEQVFAGVFFQTGDIAGGFRLRPGIDGATGEGYRIAGINFDFTYGFPLGASGWTLVQGGGPSVIITRIPDLDLRDTSVGAHYLFGFGHDSGFFTEVRIGSGRAQRLKVGVGWAITLN